MQEAPPTREFGPPPVDPSWLILQRLDDVRREQERLQQHVDRRLEEVRQEQVLLRQELGELRQHVDAEIGQLRQHVDQRIDRLTGWFIAGLVAVLAAILGLGLVGG